MSTTIMPPTATSGDSLERQREQFSRRRFPAMPPAGAIAWSPVALASLLPGPRQTVWALFICVGGIFYLALPL